MKYNINASGKGKLSADQKRSTLWSKCAAKFGKVAKCAAGAKSLRTTGLWPVYIVQLHIDHLLSCTKIVNCVFHGEKTRIICTIHIPLTILPQAFFLLVLIRFLL